MKTVEILMGIIFIMTGSLSLISALKNAEWFFKTTNATFLVKIFGRNISRIIYGIAGVAIIMLGILFISGKGIS